MAPTTSEIELSISSGLDPSTLESRLKVPGLGFSYNRFLGDLENLADVVHDDWMVLEREGVTHDYIADSINCLFRIGEEESKRIREGWDTLFYGISRKMPEAARKRFGFRDEITASEDAADYLSNGFGYLMPTVALLGGLRSCPWGCGHSTPNAGVLFKGNLDSDLKLKLVLVQWGDYKKFSELQKNVEEIFEGRGNKQQNDEHKRYISALQELQHETDRKYIALSGLLPHLIKEHHFFEGRGSHYRADPAFLIKAFDNLI